jgi:hypothetical protein
MEFRFQNAETRRLPSDSNLFPYLTILTSEGGMALSPMCHLLPPPYISLFTFHRFGTLLACLLKLRRRHGSSFSQTQGMLFKTPQRGRRTQDARVSRGPSFVPVITRDVIITKSPHSTTPGIWLRDNSRAAGSAISGICRSIM